MNMLNQLILMLNPSLNLKRQMIYVIFHTNIESMIEVNNWDCIASFMPLDIPDP
jgi:hypothetical protein